ncbi:MAG TPA: extracellular solute-binding protein, partial [Anaerolineae bacterium]
MKRFVLLALVVIALGVAACAPAPTPVPPPPPPTAVPQAAAPTVPSAPTTAPSAPTAVPAATAKPTAVPATAAPTAAPTVAPTSSTPVKLTFWYALSGNTGKVLEAMVKKWNDTHANIPVEVIFQGSYADIAQKLTASVTAKTLPDVAQMGGAPTMADSGVVVNVQDLVSKADMDDIYQGFWDYNKYGDKIISMPYNNSIPVLYYNKDLFTAAGLDPNKPPATWDDLVKAAQALTKDTNADGKIDQWGLNTNTDTHWYL